MHYCFQILEPREATQGIQQSVIQYGPHKVTEYNEACLGGRLASCEAVPAQLEVDQEIARENDQRRQAADALCVNTGLVWKYVVEKKTWLFQLCLQIMSKNGEVCYI